MLSRSFYNTQPFGLLALLALGACVSDPNMTRDTSGNPNPTEVTVSDSNTVIETDSDVDTATQAQIDEGQRYNEWVGNIDPFVNQNEDWTYTLNWSEFVDSTETSYPEVYDHYLNDGPVTLDTETIDALLNDLAITNQYALEDYEAQSSGGAPPPSYSSYTYWWGRKWYFTGSDANYAEYYLCGSALIYGYWGGIPAVYVGGMCYVAGNCNDAYGRFAIYYVWGSPAYWVGCS